MGDAIEIRSTRHELAKQEQEEEKPKPRLGRRESEPHSDEINHLYEVLSFNYPNDRTFWDLHHYFFFEGERLDIQFDISYFRDMDVPFRISSYDARKFGNRVPTMAINVLSSSTFKNDLGIVLQQCQRLGVPVYVILSDHLPSPSYVKAPLLKIYYEEGGQYRTVETSAICCKEGEEVDQSKLLDVRPDLLPFKLGIMERKQKYLKDELTPLYFLVLVDRKTGKRLLTPKEMAAQRALEAQKQAEEAQKRAEEAQKRAEKAQKQAEELQRKLMEEEKKRQEAEKRAEDAEKKLKEVGKA